ncbi:10541_t:CDS:2, partial [Racocetra fulgida]
MSEENSVKDEKESTAPDLYPSFKDTLEKLEDGIENATTKIEKLEDGINSKIENLENGIGGKIDM